MPWHLWQLFCQHRMALLILSGVFSTCALLQAIETLQELSNGCQPDDKDFQMTDMAKPLGIRVPKPNQFSNASQIVSPRTPCQSFSDSKRCVNCQCTSTPLWRKDKSSGLMYCNACGIYFKNHGKHRPLELIEGLGQSKLQQPSSGIVTCVVQIACNAPCIPFPSVL